MNINKVIELLMVLGLFSLKINWKRNWVFNMKLTNHGWGLREMIFLSAVIFFFVIVAAVMVNNLYSDLNLSQNNDSSSTSSNGYTYQDIEQNLSSAARRYYRSHSDDTSTIVISEDLVELGYLKSSQLETNDDVCEGYAIIADDFEPYITCSYYETEGY